MDITETHGRKLGPMCDTSILLCHSNKAVCRVGNRQKEQNAMSQSNFLSSFSFFYNDFALLPGTVQLFVNDGFCKVVNKCNSISLSWIILTQRKVVKSIFNRFIFVSNLFKRIQRGEEMALQNCLRINNLIYANCIFFLILLHLNVL